MELSEGERADVAGALLESLDGPSDAGVEDAWADEIKRRIDDVESGRVDTIPWEEANQQLQKDRGSRRRRP